MNEFSFGDAIKDARNIVDSLTYMSYTHNRRISPHVTPEQWKTVFGANTVEIFEPLFQLENVESEVDDNHAS